MGIDWSSVVLNPLMAVFSINYEVNPVSSRPGDPPYTARGVFTTTAVDVPLPQGGIMSDQQTTMGIRLADFDGPPPGPPGDLLTLESDGRRFVVLDIDIDGQGGAKLALRALTP